MTADPTAHLRRAARNMPADARLAAGRIAQNLPALDRRHPDHLREAVRLMLRQDIEIVAASMGR